MDYKIETKFKKNFIWNLIGTSLNAFNSLFFMVIVTRVNGITDSGIFTLAFSLACLLCIIGGYEGRVFQVTDVKGEFHDKEYIVHRFITTTFMMVIALIYTIFKGYDADKLFITLILCAVKGLEVIADVFYGVLQKNNELYKVGISLTIKSILSVIVFYLIDFLTKSMLLSCLGLVIIWMFVLIVYDIPQTAGFIDRKVFIKRKKLVKLFQSGFFAFSILFLSMYLINAPRYVLDGEVSESLQAIYGIILMPATVISLCAQYILQPFLGRLSYAYKQKNKDSFRKIVRFIFIIIISLGIVALICCYLIGIPILNIIYGVKLDDYLLYLMLIIIGAIFYALGTLFSTALTTVRKTFIQFLIYSISSIFGLVISINLIHLSGLYGAALSYLLIMIFQFILYIVCYFIVIMKIDFHKQIGEEITNEN